MMSTGSRNSHLFEEESTFKVLVASNLHLGFAEREQSRSLDSFVTFSEIIDIAKKVAADFIFVTGNIFHEARPSRWAVHSALDLLRTNCLGSLPIRIECLNDWSRPLKEGSASLHMPNFVDPNINVELPVFVIHGFSDDPSGLGNLSELDTLDRAGMVNYFGKMSNNDSVHLQPLLLRKGATLLSLYSLGAVREEHLKRMTEQKSISFTRPSENCESWFNLLAIHQPYNNKGRSHDCVTDLVEPWIDLLINGQNHEGSKEILNQGVNFRYIEPGSTIRTNMCEEEVAPKHVLLLEICRRECRVEAVALKTVRPLILDRFVWDNNGVMTDVEAGEFTEELKIMVQRVIERAQRKRTNNPKLPWPPIVQIAVENSGKQINPMRLGQHFADLVVNPKQMIKLIARRPTGKHDGKDVKIEEDSSASVFDEVKSSCIDEAVAVTLFEHEKKGNFGVLTAKVMLEAMKLYVDKEDNIAIMDAYDWEKKLVLEHMFQQETYPSTVDEALKEMNDFHEHRQTQKLEETFLVHHSERLSQPKGKAKATSVASEASNGAGKEKRQAKRSSSRDSEVEIINGDSIPVPITRARRNKAVAAAIVDTGHESEPTSESSNEPISANGSRKGRGRPAKTTAQDVASQVFQMSSGNGNLSTVISSRNSRSTTSSVASPRPVRGRPRGRREAR